MQKEMVVHRFIRTDKQEIPHHLLLSASKLYCEVWKEEPWKEFDWKVGEVINDLRSISQKPGGMLILAELESRVVGLTAGWEITLDEFISRTGQGTALTENLPKKIFYIAELCTDCKTRGQGIATKLCEELFRETARQNFDYHVLRTHIKAEPARRIYAKFGFLELPYCDIDFPDRTYWVR